MSRQQFNEPVLSSPKAGRCVAPLKSISPKIDLSDFTILLGDDLIVPFFHDSKQEKLFPFDMNLRIGISNVQLRSSVSLRVTPMFCYTLAPLATISKKFFGRNTSSRPVGRSVFRTAV